VTKEVKQIGGETWGMAVAMGGRTITNAYKRENPMGIFWKGIFVGAKGVKGRSLCSLGKRALCI